MGSILLGRCHTTILSGLFQAGQKGGLTNVVQLRSKRVFSTFPIGAKQNNTLGIDSTRSVSYHHFEWAFQSRAKSRVDERRPIAFKTRFFDFPHQGKRNNTLGIDSTRSVSYHHFEWAFPSRAKSRVDERRPIAFKTRFFHFPHRGERKKHPWDRFPLGRFHTTILSGLFQAVQKGGLTNVVQLRSRRVFSTFPIGAKRNNTLGIDSSRSVSFHHFEWAFPSRAKSRVDERRPIAFKTRFFDFPHRGETKQHPWDRFHYVGFIPPF